MVWRDFFLFLAGGQLFSEISEYVCLKYLCDFKTELWVLRVRSCYPPFKDGSLVILKWISFSWNNENKVLRIETGPFRAKAAKFNHIALHCISTSPLEKWRALLRWSLHNWLTAWMFLQSCHCLSTLCDVCIYPSWTERRWHLSSSAVLTQGQQIPPFQPRFSGSGTCTSLLGQCWNHNLLFHVVFHRHCSSSSSFSCSFHQKGGLWEQTKSFQAR